MELHVHEWGPRDGEPLVCLHGVTGHGERFKRLAEERWAATRRVLAPDLRGHGRSGWDAPWTYPTYVAGLAETAAALGIERADWAGHSFGGQLILELAAAHPSLVRRAILLDPAIQVLPHVATQHAEENMREAVYVDRDAYLAERLDSNPQTPRFHVEADIDQHCELLPDGRLRRRTCQPQSSRSTARSLLRHRRRRPCVFRRSSSTRPPSVSSVRARSTPTAPHSATSWVSSRCPACTW